MGSERNAAIDIGLLSWLLEVDRAYSLLIRAERAIPGEIEYEMYRSACIKEFEIILEQSGKLLRKALRPWFHSTKAVDKLMFKDVFRNALQRGLLNEPAVERWMQYRDNRNNTAHHYGVNFAEETILLLPRFIEDASALVEVLQQQKEDK